MPSSDSVTGKILYVEDDVATARLVKALAESNGYSLRILPSGRDFLKRVVEDPPDLCLIDLNLPDASGLDLLKHLREKHPGIPAIIVTGSEAVRDAVASMKAGAVDYVTKPPDAARLSVSLRNALRAVQRDREIEQLRSKVVDDHRPESLVGASAPMEAVRNLIRKIAPSEATVLIQGENGTGKELVAKALHFSSARRNGPFVDVNCAALTETLLESELFGHEQGAFTGASSRRKGKFEQAHGGTIFLDEIGDMPLATQSKMLRVLQERSFQRVGGDERIAVDVRVLCATNQNLEEAVQKGQFRKDLFYRVNTVVIEAPPLRQRVEDIPELSRHFLARAIRREKRSIARFSPEATASMARHSWPGNVRELQHAVERAVLVCEGDEIRPEHLPPALLRGAADPAPVQTTGGNLVEAVERLERTMIVDALEKNGWIKARAARALGVTERMISYKMENLGIRKE